MEVRGGGLELLDGFKRVRAAKALGWTELRAQVLASSRRPEV
jgi:ParB-like chromosome segregation protein Spo0J